MLVILPENSMVRTDEVPEHGRKAIKGDCFQKRRKGGVSELPLINLMAFPEKKNRTMFVSCRKPLIKKSQGRFVDNQLVPPVRC